MMVKNVSDVTRIGFLHVQIHPEQMSTRLTLLDEPDFARTGHFMGFGGRTRSQRQIASGRTTLPQSHNQA